MISEWNIRSCAPACSACGAPFADRQVVHSRLYFSDEGWVRRDFCAACAGRDSAPALSGWSSPFRAPAPKAPEPLRRETAESLLRELMETDRTDKRNSIFILAVMLERRRIFVEKSVSVQPDGLKVRVYEHRQTGESFVIPDPGLRLAEIEAVQTEVMQLLGIPLPKSKQQPQPAAPAAQPTEQT